MFREKLERIIYDYTLSNYERIDVTAGKCKYNFRCQFNAVHEAVDKGDKKIAMCIYFDNCKVYPIIHFINYRKGKFIDNTLGHWSSQHEYYLVRFIPKEDFFNINYIFGAFRKTLTNVLPWYIRIFNKETL